MRFAKPLLTLALIVSAFATPGLSLAQSNEAKWQTEWLQMRDGRRLRGVLLAESDQEMEFAEIIRRPGKPVFAIVRPLAKSEIETTHRLAGPARIRLLQRYNRLRTRATIELGQMKNVKLRRADGRPAKFAYDGDWFVLLSTADPETTKRCVVRVEQVVRAYRQWLPPRRQPSSKLRVLVFGSMEQYRSFLSERGWDIRNPAFYVPDLNMIVAGSDVGRFADRLAKSREQAAALQKKYEAIDREFPQRLREIQKELAMAGFNDRQIKNELTLRKKGWEDEKAGLQRQITRVNRQNEAKFSVVTRSMFARLYHEAFHAYFENYVFARRKAQMPSWLNEGLAQIFEKGQLDDGTLRIDGANEDALRRLKRDYGSGQMMPLRQLLESRPQSFLAQHANSSSTRSYAYAWALSRILVDEFALLSNEKLSRFVAGARDTTPQKRFEELVGMPLKRFESKWHAAVQHLCEQRPANYQRASQ